MTERNIYGNRGIKCHACNVMYCTPKDDSEIKECEQCGSNQIELLNEQKSNSMIQEALRQSMKSMI